MKKLTKESWDKFMKELDIEIKNTPPKSYSLDDIPMRPELRQKINDAIIQDLKDNDYE